MSKRGRRPRGKTPMPTTTITALAEELIFYTLLGDGATSLGVQRAVRQLLEHDPEAGKLMKQAAWMRERAELTLAQRGEVETNQKDVYKFISAHFYELAEEWAENNESN
ncbi:MAG: hypothetical protein DCC51_07270 [Anaerolineae bacterium]|nr:MAG: hypothetical protein DCC51_07270 [Anaerolineae bacterium]